MRANPEVTAILRGIIRNLEAPKKEDKKRRKDATAAADEEMEV